MAVAGGGGEEDWAKAEPGAPNTITPSARSDQRIHIPKQRRSIDLSPEIKKERIWRETATYFFSVVIPIGESRITHMP